MTFLGKRCTSRISVEQEVFIETRGFLADALLAWAGRFYFRGGSSHPENLSAPAIAKFIPIRGQQSFKINDNPWKSGLADR